MDDSVLSFHIIDLHAVYNFWVVKKLWVVKKQSGCFNWGDEVLI